MTFTILSGPPTETFHFALLFVVCPLVPYTGLTQKSCRKFRFGENFAGDNCKRQCYFLDQKVKVKTIQSSDQVYS